MSMRDWMNENSTVVTVGAVALLVVALVVLVTQTGGGPRGGGQAWFYDTQTEEFFTASSDQRPPITSPEGNEAVRAYRFSCGACNEQEMFVGYYEKHLGDEAQERPTGPEDASRIMVEQYGAGMGGRQHSLDAQNWVPASELPANELQERADAECEDGPAKPCDP